jgi:hypothetical protein
MEAKQGVKQVWRSRAEAERIAEEFAKSGLRRKAFSRERGLSVHTLDVYRRRLREEQGQGEIAGRLLAVEISPPLRGGGGELSVLLANGRSIEVRRGFDVDTLQQLLAALERL